MKNRIILILCFCAFYFSLWAETKITDTLVHEIITECVSKTGGFIIKDETKDNKDKDVIIALPKGVGIYEIAKNLSPLMGEIENYYYSIKPWKVLENGYVGNFNLSRDGSNRALSFVYMQNENLLYINDSPSNSPNLSFPTSFITKLQNVVVWGAVNCTDGFIREETYEDISSNESRYNVAIQLQNDITATTLISKLIPISTLLEVQYYLAEPWKQGNDGVLECEYFAQLEKYNKNMFINFYYFPIPHVLLINFYTVPDK